jgi:hypothetical protein
VSSRYRKREQRMLLDLRYRGGQSWDARVKMWSLLDTRRIVGDRRRSPLLDAYASAAHLPDEPVDHAELKLMVPARFSFIENPEETLEVLEQFVRGARRNVAEVYVDQKNCTVVDLCAGTVLNVLAREAGKRTGTSFAGHYPVNEEAAEIVAATGLPNMLGLSRAPRHFSRFATQRGGKNCRPLVRTASKQQAASSMADYVERCFRRVRYELRREAKRRIGNLAGEVLANAEGHAAQHDWWVDAYMRLPEGKPYGDCHLTLFNFGPSIAETLQGVASSELREVILELIRDHRKRLYFVSRTDWTEAALWTLYALQEGVSRHYGEPGMHRGVGTCDMIEEFQHLGRTIGGEQPKMCLISGHTHIVFDPKYRMEEVLMADGTRRRSIAFNQQNDLSIPPDHGTVRHLQRYFPGTLISMRFYMHEPYLQRLEHSHGSRRHRSREV